MISRMPNRTCPRTSVTIPLMTSTTAINHKMKTIRPSQNFDVLSRVPQKPVV